MASSIQPKQTTIHPVQSTPKDSPLKRDSLIQRIYQAVASFFSDLCRIVRNGAGSILCCFRKKAQIIEKKETSSKLPKKLALFQNLPALNNIDRSDPETLRFLKTSIVLFAKSLGVRQKKEEKQQGPGTNYLTQFKKDFQEYDPVVFDLIYRAFMRALVFSLKKVSIPSIENAYPDFQKDLMYCQDLFEQMSDEQKEIAIDSSDCPSPSSPPLLIALYMGISNLAGRLIRNKDFDNLTTALWIGEFPELFEMEPNLNLWD